jgi:hypothetical protein
LTYNALSVYIGLAKTKNAYTEAYSMLDVSPLKIPLVHCMYV